MLEKRDLTRTCCLMLAIMECSESLKVYCEVLRTVLEPNWFS